MPNKRIALVLVGLWFFSSNLFSQYANNWFFGNYAGLTFTSTPPSTVTGGQINQPDNASTISDANSHLLFYTNGINVWNKNHSVMSNGSGLVGSITGGQCALIVPIPCSSTKYVIFHTTDFSNPGYLNYTVVDMSLNSGLGDVVSTQKNVSLGSGWTEKLCAYYYPAGNFYWVLTHKWNSDAYVAFKVTSSSIATTSVVTNIGTSHTCGTYGGAHDAMGQLTISPDGSKVINALTCSDKFELFDFNLATGALSNSISLSGDGNKAWGTAFSPDSKKVYASTIFGTKIYQYDLFSFNYTSVAASLYTVVTVSTSGYNFGYMELGPDNKIYIARPSTYSLSVVHSPNSASVSCNFSLASQSIGTYSSSHGLSRIAYNIMPSATLTLPTNAASSSCFGAAVTLTVAGVSTCTWTPGNMTGSMVSVSPSLSTIYTVQGQSTQGCAASGTVMVTVPPQVSLTASAINQTACVGATAAVTGSASGGNGGFMYAWSTGSTNDTALVSSNVAGVFVYTLTATDASACAKTSTLSVQYPIVGHLSTHSIDVCPSVVSTHTASGAANYTWLPGGITGSVNTFSLNTPSTFTVVGMSSAGCLFDTTILIGIRPTPTLSFNTFTINCANLGTATVTPTGGIGPFNYTWQPGGQIGQQVGGMFPGQHTVTVLDQGTGCEVAHTVSFSPLVPMTGTVVSTPSVPCNGVGTGTAYMVLSGGSSAQNYTWTTPVGQQFGTTAVSLAGGVHTVQVNDALTFCAVSHTFFILQPPAISITLTSSTPTVCVGDSVSFLSNVSGGTPGYLYSWNNGPAAATYTVAELSAGIKNYTLNVTDSYSCVASQIIPITHIPNPTVTANSVTICPMQAVILSGQGATTYTWSNSIQSQSLTLTPSVTSQYTVSGTSQGCTRSAIADIFVKLAPTTSITMDSSICVGETLALSTGSQTAYQWKGPANFNSTQQNPVLSALQMTNSGVYALTVTAANGCTAGATKQLSVHPLPQVVTFNAQACESYSLHLMAGYFNNTSYSWIGPHGFTTGLQNFDRVPADTSMTGTYSVTLTSAFGCTASGVSQVSVTPLPTVNVIGDQTVCDGDTLSLVASGASSYVWSGPGSAWSTNSLLFIPQTHAGGSYTLTSSIGACTINATYQVTVYPLPVPIISIAPLPACENATVALMHQVTNASTQWSSAQGNSTANPWILGSLGLSSTAIYSLTVADQNGCVGSDTVKINVFPAPQITAFGSTVCAQEQIMITAQGSNNYQWYGPNSFSATSDTAYIQPAVVSQSGDYTVTTVGANGCVGTAVAAVVVNNFPVPTPSVGWYPLKPCQGSTVALYGGGGITYQWTGPQSFTSSSSTTTVFLKDSANNGQYVLTVRNESNCAAQVTVVVKMIPLGTPQLKLDIYKQCVPVCVKASVELKNAVLRSYTLQPLKNGVVKPDGFCIADPGTYTVNVIYTDTNNCSGTVKTNFTGLPTPKADFEMRPERPLAGDEEVLFINTSSGLADPVWYILEGDRVDTLVTRDASHLYQQPGIHVTSLVMTNSFGCSDTAIRTILVDDDFRIYVPNAFTPNGDGLNDIFLAKGSGIAKFSIAIYDRWGLLIFESNDMQKGWDGTFHGRKVKEDLYAWKLQISSARGENKSLTGHVTVPRASLPEE